jgi:uncharacterized membrane protein YfcA
LVSTRAALLLGASSVIAVFVTRKFIIPVIPPTIGRVGNYTITTAYAIMVLLAILMLLASVSLLQPNAGKPASTSPALNAYKLPLYGLALGFITGLLGIGGGFLVIPVLVLLAGLPAKQAVGTSLCIITVNSFIGFTGDIGHFVIDWVLLCKITAVAIAGIFAGDLVSKKIQGEQLKKIFGWFLLSVTMYIFVKEIILR